MQDYIITYSKIKFYPLQPRMEDIEIEDIAHSLSQMARANGHFKHFYSVAQHSINCSKEAKARGYSERVQLGCLLHDASEAYLADITRPVKKYLTEYLIFEDKLQKVIYERFNIGDVTEDELNQIKEIDDTLLYYEFRELMGIDLPSSKPVIMKLHDFSQRDFKEVEKEFILLAESFNSRKKFYKSIGIDGCKDGFAVAAISEDDFELRICSSLEEIAALYDRSDSIIIDMPLGLPESIGDIRPEAEARKLLSSRSSTVFNVPCRQAVYTEDYRKANEMNREVLGKGLSRQSYGIMGKIREVDEFLHRNPNYKNRLLEGHPEICFGMLNKKGSYFEPIYDSKKTAEGREKRLELLKRYYHKADSASEIIFSNSKFSAASDDFIDALCLAVTGLSGLKQGLSTIPEKPMEDRRGILMQMVYVEM